MTSEAANLLAGAPSPAPAGAPAAPAAAPVAAAPAAPSPAPAGAPAAAPAGAPAAPPAWAAELSAEDQALVTAKGYKTPAEALAALRSFAPPEKADDYEIPVPDGEDPAFAKAMAPLFHKAGLTAGQAKALATEWNGYQAAQAAAARQTEEAAAAATGAKNEREQAALKQEWGEAFDANSERGRRAFAKGAEAAGLSADEMSAAIDTMSEKFGFARTIKLMSFYGKHFAEDGAPGLNGGALTVRKGAQGMYENSNMNP